jgi:hypothetical protein
MNLSLIFNLKSTVNKNILWENYVKDKKMSPEARVFCEPERTLDSLKCLGLEYNLLIPLRSKKWGISIKMVK